MHLHCTDPVVQRSTDPRTSTMCTNNIQNNYQTAQTHKAVSCLRNQSTRTYSIHTCTMTTVQFQWHFTRHVQNSPSPQHYVAQNSRWSFVLFCLQSGLLENVDEYSQNILGAQALYNKQPIIFLGYECGSRNFFKSL